MIRKMISNKKNDIQGTEVEVLQSNQRVAVDTIKICNTTATNRRVVPDLL